MIKVKQSVKRQLLWPVVKKHVKRGQKVHSVALPALNVIDQTQQYEARVTPSHLVDEWLP
jgi:hypothetical protein